MRALAVRCVLCVCVLCVCVCSALGWILTYTYRLYMECLPPTASLLPHLRSPGEVAALPFVVSSRSLGLPQTSLHTSRTHTPSSGWILVSGPLLLAGPSLLT